MGCFDWVVLGAARALEDCVVPVCSGSRLPQSSVVFGGSDVSPFLFLSPALRRYRKGGSHRQCSARKRRDEMFGFYTFSIDQATLYQACPLGK